MSAIGIEAPAVVNASEGDNVSIVATAGSGDPHSLITIQVSGAPLALTLTTTGILPRVGTLGGFLGFDTAGTWDIRWVAFDQFGARDSTTTRLIVSDTPTGGPVADAGGPYSGLLFVPVSFDGTGSSDPDGDALTYSWDFGDGGSGTGATPSHTYVATGRYSITLVVSDGVLFDVDETYVQIINALYATAFVTGGDQVVRLSSGKPYTCVQIEPLYATFRVTDVDLTSFRMSFQDRSIQSIPEKAAIGSDVNRNGVPEVTVCFAKSDLRTLFAGLPTGENSVQVSIEGNHLAGNPIGADLSLRVQAKGSGLAAMIHPNPLNPSARLSFVTSHVGAVTVRMFTVSGHLIRTIRDDPGAQAGYHELVIDGKDARGNPLATGLYFVRIESSSDGDTTQRAILLR